MATVRIEYPAQSRSRRTDDLRSEVSETRQSVLVNNVVRPAPTEVVERINNSLQALVNLYYLIAREARLEPQLQALVTQTQAELAQLSRWMKKLGPLADRPHMQPGGVK